MDDKITMARHGEIIKELALDQLTKIVLSKSCNVYRIVIKELGFGQKTVLYIKDEEAALKIFEELEKNKDKIEIPSTLI